MPDWMAEHGAVARGGVDFIWPGFRHARRIKFKVQSSKFKVETFRCREIRYALARTITDATFENLCLAFPLEGLLCQGLHV